MSLKILLAVILCIIILLIAYILPKKVKKIYLIVVLIFTILVLSVPIVTKVWCLKKLENQISEEKIRLQENKTEFSKFKAELLNKDTYIEINDLSLGETSAFMDDAVLYDDEKIYKITPENEIYIYEVEERTFSAWGYGRVDFELMRRNLEAELDKLKNENSRYVSSKKYKIDGETVQKIVNIVEENLNEYKIADISKYKLIAENESTPKKYFLPRIITTIKGEQYDFGGGCLLNIPNSQIYCVVNPNIFELIDSVIEENIKSNEI